MSDDPAKAGFLCLHAFGGDDGDLGDLAVVGEDADEARPLPGGDGGASEK